MNKKEARLIKKWRKKSTWRAIARRAAEEWPDRKYCSGNQIEGMELCFTAAKTLKEDPESKAWN